MSSKVPNIIIILYSSLVGKTGTIFPLEKNALAIKEACFIHSMIFYVYLLLPLILVKFCVRVYAMSKTYEASFQIKILKLKLSCLQKNSVMDILLKLFPSLTEREK